MVLGRSFSHTQCKEQQKKWKARRRRRYKSTSGWDHHLIHFALLRRRGGRGRPNLKTDVKFSPTPPLLGFSRWRFLCVIFSRLENYYRPCSPLAIDPIANRLQPQHSTCCNGFFEFSPFIFSLSQFARPSANCAGPLSFPFNSR